jgi:PIN domain nuclease of toxin-antitoxin system
MERKNMKGGSLNRASVPFARLLMAQAQIFDAVLVSPDKLSHHYGANVLW